MLSKPLIKYFKSLQLKKYRRQEGRFLVEGAKGVLEVLKSGMKVSHLLLTPEFKSSIAPELLLKRGFIEVSEKDLVMAGTFQSNQAGMAVVEMPDLPGLQLQSGELTLALDDVRDPGNLGTIIRVADWYGITQVVCSPTCADVYNPKVINASMGSFTRVNLWYKQLEALLSQSTQPVYGALLQGENIYESPLKPEGILLMGNESKGVSPELASLVDRAVHIPRRGRAESLNVSVATAVILDNFYRGSVVKKF